VCTAAATAHAEHGTVLVVGIDGDVEVGTRRGRVVIVPPDETYALRRRGRR